MSRPSTTPRSGVVLPVLAHRCPQLDELEPRADAQYGKVPGRIVLACQATRGAAYHWQMSMGTDPKAWSDLPETVRATLTVDGLTPATTCAFRLRTLTKDGLSDWSGVVTTIAH